MSLFIWGRLIGVVCGAVGQLNLHLPCTLLMALIPNTRVTHARLCVTRPFTFSRAPTLDIPNHAARYVCTGTLLNVTEARHFALSVPLYTHFTSPIRRMADVVVHSLRIGQLESRASALPCRDFGHVIVNHTQRIERDSARKGDIPKA